MQKKSIRVLVIGAHPDDCEDKIGGVAAKYRAGGHAVKFVSVTNGDAGHHKIGGPELARRRAAEAARVSETTGIEYEILDNHDGQLVASVAIREKLIGLIREFKPDLVFTHRTNDYHPDHRNTALLVQDCSYLIKVQNICPDVPALSEAPIILYLFDGFQKPYPLIADVVVAIDDVFDEKLQMIDCHESQMYEWLPYVGGYESDAPAGKDGRIDWLRSRYTKRDGSVADLYREALFARYGQDGGIKIRCAEVFEVSEYGSPLPQSEIDTLFPL